MWIRWLAFFMMTFVAANVIGCGKKSSTSPSSADKSNGTQSVQNEPNGLTPTIFFQPQKLEEKEFEIAENVKMTFCRIPAGRSLLGSPVEENGRSGNEVEHEFVTDGFWLGKFEVMQIEWETIMGKNPSQNQGVKLPVERVSWEDCQLFLKKCKVQGHKVKLPHEDEWEYACRGGKGNKQPFYWGSSLSGKEANCNTSYDPPYGTSEKSFTPGQTIAVGRYENIVPHPWGLCDMSGNVEERCENLFSKNGTDRAVRGGCFAFGAVQCRSAFRYPSDTEGRGRVIGLRLMLKPQ